MKKLSSLFLAAFLWPVVAFAQVEVPATITFDDPPPWAGGGSSGYSQRLELYKTDDTVSAFKKVGSTVVLRTGTEIEFLGALYAPTTDQTVTLPTLTAGTDYRIAIKTDGALQAYTYADTLPTGAKVLGGFHYAPGALATGLDTGGNATPGIHEWSMWDINYRPSCSPLGMADIGGMGVWIDIYFQGNGSNADGVSRNNDTILTGSNPPIIAAKFGGNGSTKYTTFNWWEMNEHLRQWGKRFPSYAEMVAASFGTNEQAGRGSHPVKTGLNTANSSPSSDANFTSKYLFQATGVLWTPTGDLSDWQGTATTNPHGWEAYNVTGNRGKLILQNTDDLTYILFGASYVYQLSTSPTGVGAVAGSRTAETIEKLWDSSASIGLRGACNLEVRRTAH